MGMSTHVVGFRHPDDTWKAMLQAYVSCEKAGVEIPEPVLKFFGYEDPRGLSGKEVNLGKALKKYTAEEREGFEIDLTRVPEGVRYIRFYNAW